MDAWLTYSLDDFLLFSPRTYYRLFELHNRALWPAQFPAVGLGLAVLVLLHRGRGRAVAGILAAGWLWVAWAWLLQRYDTINWAARYLAAGFALQALLLLWTGAVRDRLRFRPRGTPAGWTGLAMVGFATGVQPLIGPLAGRAWMEAEIVFLAPDPTVMATLGALLAAGRTAWTLLVVPLAWCAVSGATLWAMQAPEAPLMPAAAVVTLVLAAWPARSREPSGRAFGG